MSIRKIRQLFDENQRVWFDVFEAAGIQGTTVTAIVPREDQEPAKVAKALLSVGAKLPTVGTRKDLLARVITEEAPIAHRAAQCGWYDGRDAFVSHCFVAEGSRDGPTVISPEGSYLGVAGRLKECGALRDWQKLTEVARYSTAMMISLCAAFAAPLLGVLNCPSFALVLVGKSRCGKSTAQLLGGSVYGFGTEEDLPSLNATPAGLMAAACIFNDHLFPINEVGSARGEKRNIYTVLRDATYQLVGGQDVMRHPSWTGGTLPAANTFRLIAMFSSEHSPDEWASRNGETRDDGELARLIGFPVLAEGFTTVFDQPPANFSKDDLGQWSRQQFECLRRDIPDLRGVAFRKYAEKLVGEAALEIRARNRVRAFEKNWKVEDLTPVKRDILGKFAVLYAGGAMACDFGILPFTRKEVLKAVKRACNAALGGVPDPEAALQANLRHLIFQLESSIVGIENFSDEELKTLGNASGWSEARQSGRKYVVKAATFCEWFRTPLDTKRTLMWLEDRGFLQQAKPLSTKRSLEWAQSQATWPDSTRKRSIVLFLPSGIEDLLV